MLYEKGGSLSAKSENQGKDSMGSVNSEVEAAKRRSLVVEWLNSLFPDLSMTLDASDEDLRAQLIDGTVLCAIVNKKNPNFIQSQRGVFISSQQRLDNLKRFLSAVEEMGLPRFRASDLEQGSVSAVVECLLSLKDRLSYSNGEDGIFDTNCGNQSRKRWNLSDGDRLESVDLLQGNHAKSMSSSPVLGEERGRSCSESKLQRVFRSPLMSESSNGLVHHVGHKFHEVFQLKQGRYSDLPAAKISEMMKSNSLDNAPTQSLLSVVNGILDESIERKNGEIPHRVACLLRKVVQEIERRISTQADHIRNQHDLIKAREEKYQSRIRVLETLASGTSQETQIVTNQLHTMKTERTRIEESKKSGEQDMAMMMKEKENSECMITELKQELEMTKINYENRCQQMQTERTKIEESKKNGEKDMATMMKEKENSERMITELKQELEMTKINYEKHCQQLETDAKDIKRQLEERIKEAESLLEVSKKRTNELEAFSESKFENWSKKENVLQDFVGFQLQSVKKLRMASESIRQEVIKTQKGWGEEMNGLGLKLKVLVDAAENYHSVLAENRRLYNEVLELKGNIRVCCRIRPNPPGQSGKPTIIDYIGDYGEFSVVNPSKQGKDGRRMFKFNKVFGPTATQEQVYLDIQPLVRSVLDGYNVCIFAYGQTGSGKTYTMTGPDSPTKAEWGVNYRALDDLFQISSSRKNTFRYEVSVQMVEIYNEQIRDLLSSDASQKRLGVLNTSQPSGLAVPDANMLPVKSTSDVLELMQYGQTNRAVSSTALNERSSRSHSIVTVHVRGVDLKSGSSLRGCLHLIDLAGSERVDRSEVTGDRLKEAQHINKSLSALGDVIFALAQKSSHVPYRNSKLTQVLQSSLGGQAKTLMFVQVRPDVESHSESVSTLKFAERVSGVELGAARSSKEGKDVRDLMEQVSSLKDTIARKDEEIEQLQLLKDVATQVPNGGNSLKHSSSSPGISSQGGIARRGGRLLTGRGTKSTEKALSDSENFSETSSQQSVDDLKHQMKLNGGDTSESFSADGEILGLDADLEERLSDTSDGELSIGTETDSFVSNVDEFTAVSEAGKPSETTREKMLRVTTRLTKPLSQKTGQTLSPVKSRLRDSLKSAVPRKTATTQTTTSAAKTFKH